MAHKINTVLLNLDLALANYEFKTPTPTAESLRDCLQAELLNFHDVRQPNPQELMFDIDIDDYTITIHYYAEPSEIPCNAINLGITFYMYPNVEIAEPSYLGMHDIVYVYTDNYNTEYAIAV